MPKFRVTLQSQTDEHKRYVTLSRVPCQKCDGDPVRKHSCRACKGLGDEPATKDSAVAFLEEQEREYAEFRLDDPFTIARYPALDDRSFEVVQQTCAYVPSDSMTVDGRFLRAGKVIRNPNPDPEAPRYSPAHRGWLGFHEQQEPYKVMQVGNTALKAAVTGYAWGLPIKEVLDGTAVWDWDTDTIKISLHTALDQATNFDTYNRWDDVSGTETSGTGYTTGGATLGTKTATYDTASDQSRFDAADTTWTTSTISATDSVCYKSTGTPSTSPLITSLDFGATVSTTAGTFQITHDATGIFVIDAT